MFVIDFVSEKADLSICLAYNKSNKKIQINEANPIITNSPYPTLSTFSTKSAIIITPLKFIPNNIIPITKTILISYSSYIAYREDKKYVKEILNRSIICKISSWKIGRYEKIKLSFESLNWIVKI